MHPWTQLSGYMHPWTQICTLRSFANGQLKSGNYVNEDLLMVTLSRETASGCSYFDDIWLDSWIVRKLVGKSFGSWLHLTENMIRSRPSPKVEKLSIAQVKILDIFIGSLKQYKSREALLTLPCKQAGEDKILWESRLLLTGLIWQVILFAPYLTATRLNHV